MCYPPRTFMFGRLSTYLEATFTSYDEEVGRMFVACRLCQRVVPYYKLVGTGNQGACPRCRVGTEFSPRLIPDWQAALKVLSCWLWRKHVLRRKDWDPRCPVVKKASPYA